MCKIENAFVVDLNLIFNFLSFHLRYKAHTHNLFTFKKNNPAKIDTIII